MDISIVILNYKSKGDTLNCIKSILEADWSGLSREIIVVDNNSNDQVGEIVKWQYPEVVFIQNEKNTGMGAGNNKGGSRANGKYTVIINPDTIALKDSFKVLFSYMESHPRVGAVGPKQLNPDRSVQRSGFRWHSLFTPVFRRTPLGRSNFASRDLGRFLMDDYDCGQERPVDWLLGSFLFMRTDAFKEAGMFDERYFLYFEDTDLCRTLWKKNWQVVYYPEAVIIHNHRRQSAQIDWYKFFTNKITRCHIKSWWKYSKKWGIKTPASIS